VLIVILFALCAFLTDDLLLFFIFFEGILIPMFLIIVEFGGSSERLKAGYYFLLYTVFGSVFLLFSILVISNVFGTTNVHLIELKVLNGEHSAFFLTSLSYIAFISMFVGFAVKVPMFPFHVWLPMAHVEAPTVGSVVLAGILLKLGGYGMINFLLPIFSPIVSTFSTYIIIMSLIGSIYSSFSIFRQCDIKRIIAYSSIIHMNFAVIGIFSMTKVGIVGSILLMIGHGVVSPMLFILAGILYSIYGTRVIYYYSGLYTLMPIFCLFLFLSSMINFGFPLTINFIGEIMIISGLLNNNMLLLIVLFIPLLLSVMYSLFMYNRMAHGALKVNYINTYRDLNYFEVFILMYLFLVLCLLFFFSNSFFYILYLL
jgi:proton-translocating NADH-quinone oxidoreductase chain M